MLCFCPEDTCERASRVSLATATNLHAYFAWAADDAHCVVSFLVEGAGKMAASVPSR